MSKTVAVVGASADRKKYGNKAVRAFQQKGWTVYPVNPKAEPIEGLRCYASLAEVPGPLDRVSVYVPPDVGRTLLEAIAAKKPAEVFFNPGSADGDLLEQARALGLNAVHACSIVNIGLWPDQFGDD